MATAMIHVYVAGACGEVADEREAVLAAVLAAGHWPGGPGAIAASADEVAAPLPGAILQPWIRRADAMVLVLAASDGGVGPDASQSLLEWELDEAGARGLPVITIALSDRLVAAGARRLLGPGRRERFAQLRQAAIDDGAPVVDTTAALEAAIVVGLARVLHHGERPGWIREDEVMVRGRVADELARLSAENAALRRQGPVDDPPIHGREVAGLRVDAWQALLRGRSVRDLRTRQPLTLERALLDHAPALALGLPPADKPTPFEHWLALEVAAPLCSLGLVDRDDAGALRLSAGARPLIAALSLLALGGAGEETVVATSDSALRARIAAEPAPRPRVDDEKTNFWTVDGPAPPRRSR